MCVTSVLIRYGDSEEAGKEGGRGKRFISFRCFILGSLGMKVSVERIPTASTIKDDLNKYKEIKRVNSSLILLEFPACVLLLSHTLWSL